MKIVFKIDLWSRGAKEGQTIQTRNVGRPRKIYKTDPINQ